MTLRSTAACMLAYLGPSGSLHMCCRILCLHQQVCAQKGAFSHTVPVCDTWLTWPPAALWCSLPVALWSFSAALWASLSSLCPTTAPFTLAAVSCAGGRPCHPGSPLQAARAGAAPQLTLTFAVTPVILLLLCDAPGTVRPVSTGLCSEGPTVRQPLETVPLLRHLAVVSVYPDTCTTRAPCCCPSEVCVIHYSRAGCVLNLSLSSRSSPALTALR